MRSTKGINIPQTDYESLDSIADHGFASELDERPSRGAFEALQFAVSRNRTLIECSDSIYVFRVGKQSRCESFGNLLFRAVI